MATDTAVSVRILENTETVPTGFRIMIVDSDSTSLAITSTMLRRQSYIVTTAKLATDAIDIVRKRANELDLVLTEARLPDMDGCELLEIIGKISTLPVVVLSAEYSERAMLDSLLRGAELYLVKPISGCDVKRLWQFSYPKKEEPMLSIEGISSSHQVESAEEIRSSEVSELESYSSTDGQSDENGEKNTVEKPEEDNNTTLTISKKPKLVWTNELQRRFLGAVWLLGLDDAQPKKILKLMKVPGLTKENISSHLQKHRLHVRRQREAKKKILLANSKHPSTSTSSSQSASTSHFLNPELLMTLHHQQEHCKNFNDPISLPGSVSGNHNHLPMHAIDENLNNPMITRGFDSGNFTVHLDSNQTDEPSLPPQSYQSHSNHAGSNSSGLCQNVCPQGFLMQKMSLPSLVPHSSTCTGNCLQQQFQMPQLSPLHLPSLQKQESFTDLQNHHDHHHHHHQQLRTPQLSPPPLPPPQEQETNELFDVKEEGVDDLFDLLNKPTEQPDVKEGNHNDPNGHFHSGFGSTGTDIDRDFALP